MSGTNPYRKVLESTPKQVEVDIFRRIVFGLKHAQTSDNLADRIKAITSTRVLWTTLLADIATDGNQLPADLRRGLAIVGLSIIKEIDSNDFAKVDLGFLIGLTQNIRAGLEGQAT